MQPILITGASGNVGAALVSTLLAQGHAVRAATRAGHGLPAKVARVALDLRDPASFGPALADVQQVFLMRPPALANAQRDLGPFIQAMARAGVRQVVFLSLLGAEHNRLVPHRAIEDLLRAASLPTTVLRCGFFMQNLSTTHRDEIRHHSEILVPAGRGRTAFIDVRDIATIAARTLTEPGHIGNAYPLTGDVALDYFEVASLLSQATGRSIRYRRPSLARFVRYHQSRGLPTAQIAVMTAIYLTTRLGLAATITPDATHLLGRLPTSFRTFAEDYRATWM
ncbi:MAG: SDR family oxidoreductase [Oscillochloridaceae bacterium umkhey_bin13]